MPTPAASANASETATASLPASAATLTPTLEPLRTMASSNTSAHATSAPNAEPKGALAKERQLIDAARAGVARGHAEAALAAVARHEREFPRGQFLEERDSIRILALCAQGRVADAHTYAARFRQRYAQSVFLPQIDAALGDP